MSVNWVSGYMIYSTHFLLTTDNFSHEKRYTKKPIILCFGEHNNKMREWNGKNNQFSLKHTRKLSLSVCFLFVLFGSSAQNDIPLKYKFQQIFFLLFTLTHTEILFSFSITTNYISWISTHTHTYKKIIKKASLLVSKATPGKWSKN